MRDGGAVLRRVRGDDPYSWERLFVLVRDDGRTRRMDHWMGPRARVRGGSGGGLGGMVGLPHSDSRRPRDSHPVRAVACAGTWPVDAARFARAADRAVDHRRALYRNLGERAAELDNSRHQVVRDRDRDPGGGIFRQAGELVALRAVRMAGSHEGRGGDILRVYRIRRGFDRGRRSDRSQARSADRNPRVTIRMHGALYRGRGRADRDGAGAPDRYQGAARVGLRAARDEFHCRDYLARRGGGSDLSAAGAAARAIAHLLCNLARRAAARRVQPGPSGISPAVCADDADRGRGWRDGGAVADPGNRGADEYRDAVCVRAGMPGYVDPALHGAGTEPPVSHAIGTAGTNFRSAILRLPDGESARR